MRELKVDVECPHCGHENDWVVTPFNPDEFDDHGGNSCLSEHCCFECDKDFWFYAYVSFETEVTDVFKKKPEKERG